MCFHTFLSFLKTEYNGKNWYLNTLRIQNQTCLAKGFRVIYSVRFGDTLPSLLRDFVILILTTKISKSFLVEISKMTFAHFFGCGQCAPCRLVQKYTKYSSFFMKSYSNAGSFF